MGVLAIEFQQESHFRWVVETLHSVFVRANKLGFANPNDRRVYFDKTWVWKQLILRVYALGAYLVSKQQFDWIPILVRQQVPWDEYYRDFTGHVTY